ncbi:hypothetical protein [Thioalkalivibrio sp. ALE19]|uniref:hypothetical protein n=1 Tax=Thioalkalivibrio sp. ALE19 TaxID=1266909 RepID=UPI00048C4073|nr:hypothetical protein [Thioalkalivibrio sp. ALE19]
MSEIKMGVLRMPDELFWSDEPMIRQQHNQVRYEAADEIEWLRAENARLHARVQEMDRQLGQKKCQYDRCPVLIAERSLMDRLYESLRLVRTDARCDANRGRVKELFDRDMENAQAALDEYDRRAKRKR